VDSRHEAIQLAGFPGLAAFIVVWLMFLGDVTWPLAVLFGVLAAAVVGVAAGVGLLAYVAAAHRSMRPAAGTRGARAAAEAEAYPGVEEEQIVATAPRGGERSEPQPSRQGLEPEPSGTVAAPGTEAAERATDPSAAVDESGSGDEVPTAFGSDRPPRFSPFRRRRDG
jgi:hypothetical protein